MTPPAEDRPPQARVVELVEFNLGEKHRLSHLQLIADLWIDLADDGHAAAIRTHAGGPSRDVVVGDVAVVEIDMYEIVAPEQRLDIARIEGQVKASSVKKVADFVESHPDESVSIIRNWVHEG